MRVSPHFHFYFSILFISWTPSFQVHVARWATETRPSSVEISKTVGQFSGKCSEIRLYCFGLPLVSACPAGGRTRGARIRIPNQAAISSQTLAVDGLSILPENQSPVLFWCVDTRVPCKPMRRQDLAAWCIEFCCVGGQSAKFGTHSIARYRRDQLAVPPAPCFGIFSRAHSAPVLGAPKYPASAGIGI